VASSLASLIVLTILVRAGLSLRASSRLIMTVSRVSPSFALVLSHLTLRVDAGEISNGLGFANTQYICFKEDFFLAQPLKEVVQLEFVFKVVKCLVVVDVTSKQYFLTSSGSGLLPVAVEVLLELCLCVQECVSLDNECTVSIDGRD